MLARLRKTETTAAAMVRRAEADNDLGALPVLARHHADSCANIARVQRDLLAVQEQEGHLVSWDTVAATLRRFVVPLKSALNTLPKAMASRCNPTDPASAEIHLQEWVDEIARQIDEIESVAAAPTAPEAERHAKS